MKTMINSVKIAYSSSICYYKMFEAVIGFPRLLRFIGKPYGHSHTPLRCAISPKGNEVYEDSLRSFKQQALKHVRGRFSCANKYVLKITCI